MKTWIMAGLMTSWLSIFPAVAYESMYPKTGAGDVELKELPGRRALVAGGSGTYFQTSDGVFMKLFRYIQKHEVSMTVPVEAEIQSNQMRFFAGEDTSGRSLPDDGPVRVQDLQPRKVVSAGLRGAYTREQFDAGVAAARAWLAEPGREWVEDGEPYAVYWNRPFVPGFLKRAEVHIPVAPRR